MVKVFFDTNVLLYLLSEEAAKADRAEALLVGGGIISVQVLNEFAAVATRKLGMSHAEVRDALAPVRALCQVTPLLPSTHDEALLLAERHGFPFYDALIAAAALEARCGTLYSEDFQHGRRIGGTLKIVNPFRGIQA